MDSSTNQFAQFGQLLQSEFQEVSQNLKRLREANSTTHLLEDWQEDMLHHLAAEVGLNIHRMNLLRDHKEHNLPTLAYVVRNLLELIVWIEYCCKSKDNARHFYEDRWKDGVGFQKAIQTLMKTVPEVPNASEIKTALISLGETLQQTAVSAGISSLDQDYKRVNEAARDIGFREVFVSFNTLLSKFAHPTAMTVFAHIQGEENDRFFFIFFVIGIGLAAAGYKTINEYLRGLGTGP